MGYGTTVQQYEAHRIAASSDRKESTKITGGQLRQLRRELRAVENEKMTLGFPEFSMGSHTDSIVLSDYVYSAVDSGTSVTVAKLADSLAGFNQSATIKIMGFNGTVSRSGGKGRKAMRVSSGFGRVSAVNFDGMVKRTVQTPPP